MTMLYYVADPWSSDASNQTETLSNLRLNRRRFAEMLEGVIITA